MDQAGEEPWASLVPALLTPGLTLKLDRLAQGHTQFQNSLASPRGMRWNAVTLSR